MFLVFRRSLFVAASLLAAAVSVPATQITIDFGTGSGVLSAWPGSAAGANNNVGIVLPTPLLLDAGELQITASPGSLVCAASTTNASLCANTQAYGLGVTGGAQDPRIDGGESITLTLTDPGYSVSLVAFGITGFNASEQGQFSVDGGSQHLFSPPAGTFTLVTPLALTNNIVWMVPTGNGGNYTLSSLTLDITGTAVPEPGSLALAGLALAGFGLAFRRKTVQ